PAPTARLSGPEEPEDAMSDERYYPTDGTYIPHPGIFATWLGARSDAPNPCRKYHVSTDLTCAGKLAAVALPILQDLKLSHKIVQSHSRLVRMQSGNQAGKFITIYAALHRPPEELIEQLGGALANTPGLCPSPRLPRSRHYLHVFMEAPLDPGMFIYGGFETDPAK